MKPIKVETTFYAFDSIGNLPVDVQQLMETAVEARLKAHAEYSKFSVGAAVLLDNDEVISGSNQENAAYPVSLCTERVPFFAAKANKPAASLHLVVIADRS